MSSVRTFFRHCPQCGRRFEVRLVSKKELEESSEGFPSTMKTLELKRGGRGRPQAGSVGFRAVGSPVIADVETFQYQYKCKHCGHEWNEVRVKEEKFPNTEGYTGD